MNGKRFVQIILWACLFACGGSEEMSWVVRFRLVSANLGTHSSDVCVFDGKRSARTQYK